MDQGAVEMVARFWPAGIIFLGGLLVAVGGIWQAVRQSNFTAEITQKTAEIGQKSEEIIQLNAEIRQLQKATSGEITGGDSFCEMRLLPSMLSSFSTATPFIIHHGRYPLYDLKASIMDLDAAKSSGSGLLASIGSSTSIIIGNMTPGSPEKVPRELQPTKGRDFNFSIHFVARNGAWVQQLRVHTTEQGGQETATRITRGASPNAEELFQKVTPGYPRNSQGDVDWEPN